MTAVSGSGIRSMSDSWISWKPRIDEPSNPSPSSKTPRQFVRRDGEVLHQPRQVAETEVDDLDTLLLDQRQDLLGRTPREGQGRFPLSVDV